VIGSQRCSLERDATRAARLGREPGMREEVRAPLMEMTLSVVLFLWKRQGRYWAGTGRRA
jgi:hypothetical protein